MDKDFLERYRKLSRDIQNYIQNIEKEIGLLKNEKTRAEILKDLISSMKESWSDFNGWVLISTLDNIEEAKENCVPGLINITSKTERLKHLYARNIRQKKLHLTIRNETDITATTYIAYFEQLLSLLLENAIKYSRTDGEIELYTYVQGNELFIQYDSIGPTIQKEEAEKLGTQGFRGSNALKLPLAGSGCGLYYAKKICDMLKGRINFSPNNSVICTIDNVPYSEFKVKVTLPLSVTQ